MHLLVSSVDNVLCFVVGCIIYDLAKTLTAICDCGFPVVWNNVEAEKRDYDRVLEALACLFCRVHHISGRFGRRSIVQYAECVRWGCLFVSAPPYCAYYKSYENGSVWLHQHICTQKWGSLLIVQKKRLLEWWAMEVV